MKDVLLETLKQQDRYYNFTGLVTVEETEFNSLDHSCRSELTRQGISLP